MLHSIKKMRNKALEATDGEIGQCKDFLFDDRFWTIRYMVVDTRKWLTGKKVLISPISLKKMNWNSSLLKIQLSKKQIKDAPGIEEHLPVSRQYEIACAQYYNWIPYWHGPFSWGPVKYPSGPICPNYQQTNSIANDDIEDGNLRSINEIQGYQIKALDGKLGCVKDLIVDEYSWTIRYIVVGNIGRFSKKKNYLVATVWAGCIDWTSRSQHLRLTKKQIKNSPEFHTSDLLAGKYESQLFTYPGRKWVKEKEKIANKLIKKGEKRIEESQMLKNKGEKIVAEKESELRKISSRIKEGRAIQSEGRRLIRKGEDIVADSDYPERNKGVRSLVVGRRLEATGKKRERDYKKEKGKAKEWVRTGKKILSDSKRLKESGLSLKKSGKKIIQSSKMDDY